MEPETGARFLLKVLQPLCERCGNHPARLSVKRTFLGGRETTELLCANCARQKTTEALDLMPEARIVSDIAHEGWLNELDEHIAGAPFEALMEVCFASDEGFMDDDIFGGNWGEDPFEDNESIDIPSSDFSNPFADGDEEEDAPTNLFRSIQAQEDEGEAVCPGCSATWNQIVIDERAGCPKCYAVFRVSLTALLDQVQRESTHIGKTPRAAQKRRLRLEHLRQRRDNQLQLLRNRLAEAVKSERYEEAATLRDKIKVVSSSLF